MKNWQAILKQHHDIIINLDNTVTVIGAIYDTNTRILSNDLITRTDKGYRDSQGNNYESIYEYLGY